MLSKITSWRHSKIIAFVLAVAVFLTAFYGLTPVISFADGSETETSATETVGYWDGTTITDVATAFADQEGKGGSDNPYEITNGAQLYAAVNCATDTYFKLMNDIVLQPDADLAAKVETLVANPSADTEGLKNWNPTVTFQGHIDGDFHTITGLYMSVNSSTGRTIGRGFVGSVSGTASIKNLTLDGAFMQSNCYMGGIVGRVSGGTPVIDGCSIINSYLENNSADVGEGFNTIAGIVGMSAGGSGFTVSNCSAINNTIIQTTCKDNRAAGIIGDVWGGKPTLTNCFSVGLAVCKWNQKPKGYTNVYSTESGNVAASNGSTVTTLEDAKMKGATAYAAMNLSPAHGWIVEKEDSYPVYVGTENALKAQYVTPVWDGTHTVTVDSLAGGDGTTAETAKLVSTGAELYAAVQNTSGYYFKIINDIKLQPDAAIAHLRAVSQGTETLDTTTYTLKSWQTGHSFKGNLIGDNHTIYGLYSNGTSGNYSGLIGQSGGDLTVEGVHLEACYIYNNNSGNSIAAGILARVGGSSGAVINITGCSVKYSYISGRTDTGAIAGAGYTAASCTVDKCVSSNNTLAGTKPGGIFSNNWTNVAWTVKDSISIGYKAHNTTPNSLVYTNTYSDISASGTDGSSVKVVDAALLLGKELGSFRGVNGWEIKEGEYPKYTGVITEGPESTVWDGSKSTDLTLLDGKGTSEEPYKIYTGAELYAAVKSTGANYFKLMNDIQLQSDDNMEELQKLINGDDADVSTLNDWGVSKTTFVGDIDGNFKTVSGVYIVGAAKNEGYGIGFITRTGKGASVKNLTLDTMYMTGPDKIGGIIAIHYGSGGVGEDLQITGCAVKNAKLHSTGANDTQYDSVAGIIAAHWSGGLVNIDNCAVYDVDLANETNSSRVAGIFGNNTWTSGHTIKNCISVGYKPSSATSYTTCTNVYTTAAATDTGVTANMTEAQLKGTELPEINASTGWKIEEGKYPVYTGVIGTRPSNTTTVWNGLKITSLDSLDGEGTIDRPYLIYNGAELYAAVACTDGSYFEIMNDIQLQSDAAIDHLRAVSQGTETLDTTTYTFNSWRTGHTFKGNLIGNNHTISGLYSNSATSWHGLIGISGGDLTVEGVRLEAAYLRDIGTTADSAVAGIVAGIRNSANVNIIGCSVKESYIEGKTDAGGIAGIGYSGKSCTIDKCVSSNNKIAGSKPGGLFATNWTSVAWTIKDSISIGYMAVNTTPNGTTTGTLSYTNTYSDISSAGSDGTTVTVLSKEQLQGEDVLLAGIRPLMGWEFAEGEYPKYTGKQGTETTNFVTYWNGIRAYTIDEFDGNGDGSEGNPYLIRHGFELFAALQNTDGKHFKLVNDIYLNTEARAYDWNLWESNKAFTGTLDGDGHTIYNMEEIFDKGADNSGAKNGIALIPTAANATIKNLHLRGVEVNSWTTTGTAALVGLATGNVNIEGCSITDANVGGRKAVSAFVGKTSGEVAVTVKDSVLADSVLTKNYTDAEYYAGAFVGDGSTATNITLTDVVAKGYVAVGASTEGAVAGTNDYAIVSGGDYADVAAFKAALANGTAQLSTEFYYDYLSDNAPMLKNRLATKNVDIDGNEGAGLDADDALALKNILLYGSDAQLTLSEDNANGYNDLAGVDITDLVTLLKKNN